MDETCPLCTGGGGGSMRSRRCVIPPRSADSLRAPAPAPAPGPRAGVPRASRPWARSGVGTCARAARGCLNAPLRAGLNVPQLEELQTDIDFHQGYDQVGVPVIYGGGPRRVQSVRGEGRDVSSSYGKGGGGRGTRGQRGFQGRGVGRFPSRRLPLIVQLVWKRSVWRHGASPHAAACDQVEYSVLLRELP